MLMPVKIRPGINRDSTAYANSGGWYSCNWVRFRNGFPEKIGGWTKQIATAFVGACRAMINWTILAGTQYVGMGTSAKYYITNLTTFTDITPLRRTATLGTNPFAPTSGSALVVVTDVGSNATAGAYVTFSGGTTYAGFSTGQINAEFAITSIIDGDNYRITMPQTASNSTAGGGTVVVAEYQIDPGSTSSSAGTGWGTGTWGRGTWGSSYASSTIVPLRIWSNDTFGEDLITCIRNGGIYYWDATTPTTRLVSLSSLTGGVDVPTVATEIIVSSEERHVIAFGANPLDSVVQDPLLVRWSDTEDPIDWEVLITNTAGEYRLSVGTYIVSTMRTRTQILIWTDQALYTMTWTGAPYTFSFALVGNNVSTIAPNATAALNDVAIWMGKQQFYIYDGRIQPLDCPISDFIFRSLNYDQLDKIYAFTNANFNEVGWMIPTSTNECDTCILFNYKENLWYYGSIVRTAWLDRGPTYAPLATSADFYLYNQETGFDDGSTAPVTAINAYIESSPVELDADGPGNHFMFISRLIPDVTFRNSSAASPAMTMTLKMQDYPGQTYAQTYASTVTQTSVVTVEQFTTQCFIRLRGRSVVYRAESTAAGVTWRLGQQRLGVRLDGRR